MIPVILLNSKKFPYSCDSQVIPSDSRDSQLIPRDSRVIRIHSADGTRMGGISLSPIKDSRVDSLLNQGRI